MPYDATLEPFHGHPRYTDAGITKHLDQGEIGTKISPKVGAKPHSGLAPTRHTQREKMARTGVAKVTTPQLTTDSDSDDDLVVPPEPVKVLSFIFQGAENKSLHTLKRSTFVRRMRNPSRIEPSTLQARGGSSQVSGTIHLVVKYFRVIIYTLSCRSDSISSGANSGAVTSSKPERKRKSADALSDVKKIPPKRIRSTPKGSVTVEDVDDDNDVDFVDEQRLNRRIAIDSSESESSDSESGDEMSAGGKKQVPGPGGKPNRATEHDERTPSTMRDAKAIS
ncbi:hypothetical protein B0H14DRAFT_2564218 [Mycena olivaceomarginata]|nr:hypothetical protein B0H14DRAFT_2564218 [Mycena olivaceomarginata]